MLIITTTSHHSERIEVLVYNTNLTFLSFLYKISIQVYKKNKVASSGI